MKTLNALNKSKTRDINGGETLIYSCPWNDYSSKNFWSVYAHAIKCGYKHGLFNIPLWMIRKGLTMGMG